MVGCVADLCCAENPVVGATLAGCCSSQCFGALVVRDRRVAAGLQQRFASSSPPLMLLPLDSGPPPAEADEHTGKLKVRSHAARFLASLGGAPPPGLVGFAVNLVELRDRHRVLRASVMHALFGDALVFRTLQASAAGDGGGLIRIPRRDVRPRHGVLDSPHVVLNLY